MESGVEVHRLFREGTMLTGLSGHPRGLDYWSRGRRITDFVMCRYKV